MVSHHYNAIQNFMRDQIIHYMEYKGLLDKLYAEGKIPPGIYNMGKLPSKIDYKLDYEYLYIDERISAGIKLDHDMSEGDVNVYVWGPVIWYQKYAMMKLEKGRKKQFGSLAHQPNTPVIKGVCKGIFKFDQTEDERIITKVDVEFFPDKMTFDRTYN